MQPTCLYRYFDSDGNLLYIGITQNQGMRGQQHFATSAWFGQTASATFTHFATREEALEAERSAIQTELPKYNLVHHPRRETWRSHWERIFDVSSDLRGQDEFHDSLIQWMLDNPWPSKAVCNENYKKGWLFISAVYAVAKVGEDIGPIPCAHCDNLFGGNISVESWANKGWDAIDEWLGKGSPE